MEKLQRFSIRKLSIGAVSCLIGTVTFFSYSHNVQAAETEKPQAVETAKAENEIQPEKAQDIKQNEEAKDDTQNTVADKDVAVSQKTDALTTANQTSPKENSPATNEASKANEVAKTNKTETNTLNVKPANITPTETKENKAGSVTTTEFKTNTPSKEAKPNIANLVTLAEIKLQEAKLAKPVNTKALTESKVVTEN